LMPSILLLLLKFLLQLLLLRSSLSRRSSVLALEGQFKRYSALDRLSELVSFV